MCQKTDKGFYAIVSPRMIDKDDPINCAQDVFNAVLVRSDMLDDSLYYGRGAGKLPTASAVVGDAVELAKHVGEHFSAGWSEEAEELVDIDSVEFSYFVRLDGSFADRHDELVAAFGEVSEVNAGIEGEFGVITKPVSEGSFMPAYDKLADAKGYIRLG